MPQTTDPTAVLRDALRLAVEEERELRDQYAALAELAAEQHDAAQSARAATLAALAHGRLIGFAVALAATHYAEIRESEAEPDAGLVLAAATLAALGTPDSSHPAARPGHGVGQLPEVVRGLIEPEPSPLVAAGVYPPHTGV